MLHNLSSRWDGRPFGHNRHGPKSGGTAAVPLSEGELGRHLIQRGLTEAYLHTKWHPDPSNSLVTIHHRNRQTGQDRQPSDSIGRTVLQIRCNQQTINSACCFFPFPSPVDGRQFRLWENLCSYLICFPWACTVIVAYFTVGYWS